jgi:hypothetical protein
MAYLPFGSADERMIDDSETGGRLTRALSGLLNCDPGGL